MEAIAVQKYIRISPKKIRELSRLTVGLSPETAVNRLMFLPGKAPKILTMAINSARANAVNNHKLNSGNLKIKTIVIGKGPFFKRWQPVSRGMAHPIKKKTSHLRVTVTEGIKEEKVKSLKKVQPEIKTPAEVSSRQKRDIKENK